jgi:hypothetical protein
MYRKVLMAGLLSIAGATGALLAPASAAEAIQDSYCFQGRIWGYPGNCEFSSYRQCMASAIESTPFDLPGSTRSPGRQS